MQFHRIRSADGARIDRFVITRKGRVKEAAVP